MKASKMEDILPKIKEGDLILFSGRGPTSYTIQAITKSKWTHVAIVFRYEGKLHSFESLKTVMEFYSKSHYSAGVTTIPLEQRLKENKNDMMILSLNRPLTKEQNEKLVKFPNC